MNMKSNELKFVLKKAASRGYDNGYIEGILFTAKNYSAVLLLCLKDEFGFTNEQLERVASLTTDTFDSVCNGRITLEDIKSTLEVESDITLNFTGDIVKKER